VIAAKTAYRHQNQFAVRLQEDRIAEPPKQIFRVALKTRTLEHVARIDVPQGIIAVGAVARSSAR
jgi:hypothetical protein